MITPALRFAALGTFIEWAEYALYGYLAPILSALFFPEESPTLGLIYTYAIFAFGFLTRPLGSVFLGYWGDRHSRRHALILSMLLMGLGTLLLGLLPTGTLLGTVGLLFARFLQGVGMGGEYMGACVYAIEHEPTRPALATSFMAQAAALGMVAGAALAHGTTWLDSPDAWRLPFCLGALGCFLAAYWRRRAPETFQATAPRLPMRQALRALWQGDAKFGFLQVMCLSAFVGIFVYVMNVYFLAWFTQQHTLTYQEASAWVMAAQAVVGLALPIAGLWADRLGTRVQLRRGLWVSFLAAPTLFCGAASGERLWLAVGLLAYIAGNLMVSSSVFVESYRRMPVHHRYLGLATAWSVAAALFSGTAPLFATTLEATLGLMGPVLFVMGTTCVTLVALNGEGEERKAEPTV